MGIGKDWLRARVTESLEQLPQLPNTFPSLRTALLKVFELGREVGSLASDVEKLYQLIPKPPSPDPETSKSKRSSVPSKTTKISGRLKVACTRWAEEEEGPFAAREALEAAQSKQELTFESIRQARVSKSPSESIESRGKMDSEQKEERLSELKLMTSESTMAGSMKENKESRPSSFDGLSIESVLKASSEASTETDSVVVSAFGIPEKPANREAALAAKRSSLINQYIEQHDSELTSMDRLILDSMCRCFTVLERSTSRYNFAKGDGEADSGMKDCQRFKGLINSFLEGSGHTLGPSRSPEESKSEEFRLFDQTYTLRVPKRER